MPPLRFSYLILFTTASTCIANWKNNCVQIEGRIAQSRDFFKNERATSHILASAMSDPVAFKNSYPESSAILNRRIELLGSVRPGTTTYSQDGKQVTHSPNPLDIKNILGKDYYELPNSTGFSIYDSKLRKHREFVITRAIRPYTNIIRPSEGVYNSPQGYVSDLLLSERIGNKLVAEKILLESRPVNGFNFEDPRISILYDSKGKETILLSGTDYAPHAPDSKNLFVMNRFLELQFEHGKGIKNIEIDAKTGRPHFFDMSPKPIKVEDSWVGLDAKNGTIAQRDDGKIVVRTRFRPNFEKDPTLIKYNSSYGAAAPKWSYGEQVFLFKNLDTLKQYDWSNALDDLMSSHLEVKPFNQNTTRVKPIDSKITAIDQDIPEHYPSEYLKPGKAKGFGPGTRPVKVIRLGNKIFISDGPNAPKRFAGKINSADSLKIIEEKLGLKDEGHIYLSLDHRLRYMEQATKTDPNVIVDKRVYTGSATFWDSSLLKVVRRYDDIVQPLANHQMALSGILDLHHAGYFMGYSIIKSKKGTFFLRGYAGEADAHTASYDFDMVKLLIEASKNEGQAYTPISPKRRIEGN